MKIVGLITEYNPFHNGHLYHIKESLRVTGADAAVVVMSGDYVQRGTPAIMPKRIRAEMALMCGAGAVFELPVCYATGSAELFALGSVSLLESLGIVDSICFGSECDDLPILEQLAELLLEEPEAYQILLKDYLKQGMSFPRARQEAILSYTEDPRFAEILRNPNNILGIEYLKAIKKLGSRMEPYTIARRGAQYHDEELDSDYSSATAIRSLLAYSSSSFNTEPVEGNYDELSFSGILSELENQVPKCCLELLKDYHKVQYPISQNDFSLILKYKLLNKQPESLVRYVDVSPEIASRIANQLNNFFNYKQFCDLLKTRELTQTRVNRALLHIMLGTKKAIVEEYIDNGYHMYARLLGFRKDNAKLLTAMSKESSLPVLTKMSEIEDLPELGQKMLRHDMLASNLYTSVVTDKFKTAFQNEYKQGVLKV